MTSGSETKPLRSQGRPLIRVESDASWRSVRSAHRFTALALGIFYLAVMNGHMSSMDGLYMVRQAYAFVFDHSIQFQFPVWTWRPEPTWNSMYGIGLSLLYVPGVFASKALWPWVPISVEAPTDVYEFYLRELYQDPLYAVGVCWVHALVVATAAYLVARLITEFGCSGRAALWGMGFYGLGSSALVYSRGDFAQPLEGLCWIATLLFAVRFRAKGEWPSLVACAVAASYAILTRPFEGLLLLPIAMVFLWPNGFSFQRIQELLKPLFVLGGGAMVGAVVTLLVNYLRFGEFLRFGYDADNTWVAPSFERWAGALVSPGRGLIWEFPAVVLVPLGLVVLASRGRTREAVAILVLSVTLLASTVAWYMWWGGWCWGLRLFGPAIPLLAVVAGCGVERLSEKTSGWVPALLLALGLLWAVPGVVTDILGGFGNLGDGNVWQLAAYPLYGAWQFLERVFAESFQDAGAVDILWFRMVHRTGWMSLLIPVALLAISSMLLKRSFNLLRTN
ncbi:MAG: hypothetical protein CL484_09395 [Acidobacteria bacterium]|nr:hypothetical protein [Acidobacteriota bacterium]